jgi:hypothetical protein
MEFIEILGILAKENIYFSKRTIIDHPHFDYLLKIMDLYPKGSILHNGILNIITPFLNSQNENMLIEKVRISLFSCFERKSSSPSYFKL